MYFRMQGRGKVQESKSVSVTLCMVSVSVTSGCRVLPVVCEVVAPPAASQLRLLDYKPMGIYHRHWCSYISGV